MYFNKKIFNNNFDIFDIFILLIPFSIIIGNYIINLNLIILILLGIFKYNHQIIELLKNFYLYFLFFFVFILTNLFFSDDIKLSSIGLIGLLKNLIFAFFLLCWLKSGQSKFKNLSISITLGIIILSISIFLQFIYFEYYNITYNRINGFFFDESIAGSYIVKLLAPSIIYLLLIKNNTKFALIFFILSFSAVIITGDRAPTLLYFIS